MKNSDDLTNKLVISDLSYLQTVSSTETTVLGSFASSATFTHAEPGFGQADALATAIGPQTTADTDTSVNAQIVYNFFFTTADAMARSYAHNGSQTHQEQSYSFSTSFSMSFGNWSSFSLEI